MKRLFYLLPFILLGCSASTEDLPEPEPVAVDLYYLDLAPECNLVNVNTINVTEKIYESVMRFETIGDCDTFHSIPDVNDVWHDGYLMGESTTTQ